LEANSALKADPNDPEAYLALGWSMILTGRASDGQVYVEQAMRLNPTYPGHYSLALGIAYFAQGDPKKAAAVMEGGLKLNPGALELTAPLASMYGRLGERQKARRALLLWRPTADESVVVNLPATYRFPYKWHMDQFHIRRSLDDGLQVAAMPLQTTLASWIDTAGARGNFFHRLRAIKSIGYFGPLAAEAVPILIKALSEENQKMRIEAVVALEKIGPGAKDAVAALEELKKKDVSISDRVDAALNAILK
jgi:tetratricopeptide (TPR) repeat protein